MQCFVSDKSFLTRPLDGTEWQSIKDLDGKTARPRIRSCSICDPFILIIREDDTIGLFIGEIEKGKIRRKDMSPMGEKVTELPELSMQSTLTKARRHPSTLQATSSRTQAACSKHS